MDAMAQLPTATEWWVTRRVSDDVTLVSEPHVHRFLRCNVWHIRGRDADLVVDTGMGIRPLRPFVERELDGPLIAVATHTHSDHVGGLHEFEHRVVHRDEADVVAAAQLGVLDVSVYGDTTVGVYEAAGYEFGELLIDAVPDGGVEAYYEIAPCRATRQAVSACGSRRPARCFLATRSTTVRYSTSSKARTSPTTRPPSAAFANSRSRSSMVAMRIRSVAAA